MSPMRPSAMLSAPMLLGLVLLALSVAVRALG